MSTFMQECITNDPVAAETLLFERSHPDGNILWEP